MCSKKSFSSTYLYIIVIIWTIFIKNITKDVFSFYAQVVATVLLSSAIANLVDETRDQNEILRALRELPKSMEQVISTRADIAAAAQRHAPQKRYWAVVGNGPNRIAANEIRIKLSELCYKAIPEDGTEDKKHIDLSSEPLIFVCAAGLSGSNIDDVAKEVATTIK